jgi:hypothetical protein
MLDLLLEDLEDAGVGAFIIMNNLLEQRCWQFIKIYG